MKKIKAKQSTKYIQSPCDHILTMNYDWIYSHYRPSIGKMYLHVSDNHQYTFSDLFWSWICCDKPQAFSYFNAVSASF